MDRREFLKISGLGLVGSYLPFEELIKVIAQLPPRRAVIFFCLDGCPIGDLKALFEYLKRIKGKEESAFLRLMSDSKCVATMTNTSSLSSIVTDSAPASVAWGTGAKTINRRLATLPDGTPLKTIFELAKDESYSIGCVTTTRVTHATPAGWYSHNPNRDAEDDIAVDALNLEVDLIMGGGLRHFDPASRKDGRDLLKAFQDRDYIILRSKEDLKRNYNTTKRVLGLFARSHIPYFIDRLHHESYKLSIPSLAEMTAFALRHLSQNKKGFILQVEAGRIDHANHANDAFSSLLETYEADLTLAVILEYMKRNPQALLIITSDHGNSGYGINGTGPEYNHATEAFLKYKNQKASFEYIKPLFKNKSVKEVKDIFESYMGQSITIEEAQLIYERYNNPPQVLENDYLYEPEATMGRILARSAYRASAGEYGETALIRRGNIYFTSTNHTAEDQLTLIYNPMRRMRNIAPRIDNTDLFWIMCNWMGLYYENPKMTEEEARRYVTALSHEEWKRHLINHIA